MKAKPWAREREGKEVFLSDDGYIKEMRLQTWRGFSKLCFWILKRKNIDKHSLQKMKAISSSPLSGTFFFRIPRHHENAQELKSPVTEDFQNFPPVSGGTEHKASRKLNSSLQVTQEGLETEARIELHALVTSPGPNKKSNFLALC